MQKRNVWLVSYSDADFFFFYYYYSYNMYIMLLLFFVCLFLLSVFYESSRDCEIFIRCCRVGLQWTVIKQYYTYMCIIYARSIHTSTPIINCLRETCNTIVCVCVCVSACYFCVGRDVNEPWQVWENRCFYPTTTFQYYNDNFYN